MKKQQPTFMFQDFDGLFAEQAAELFGSRPAPKTEPCAPEGCEHSDEEHEAFDAGVKAGEQNVDIFDCPYRGALREDWLSGHSLGQLNRTPDDLTYFVADDDGEFQECHLPTRK